MKKTLLLTIGLIVTSAVSTAQNVTIPDANFKAYLVSNPAINANSDTEIQVSEAAAFTGNIFGNNLGITDLTGIEAFTSLTGLYCRDNNLGSIDISSNTALTYIDCQSTNISSLNISSNTALTGFNCSYNNITSLDVSNNTALTAIQCSGNALTGLDVSNTILLSNFSCDNNDLTSIDVSNNTALSYFVCHFNNLTSLDLSTNTALTHLSCSGNNLTSLDVSNNTSLGNLYCAVNDIVNLDISANTSLLLLRCEDNNLSTLNAANGNNANMNTFIASSNPNLTCIQVDDEVYSTTNWTNIDATASFSEDCNYSLGINEVNLSQNVSIYPNPVKSQIYLNTDEKIESMNIVDLYGKTIVSNIMVNTIIDVTSLSNGIYFLQISTDKGLVSKKFIKE